MDCSTFGILIENHEPVDLIDVRPRTEFAVLHIPGARSLPLHELSPSPLSRQTFETTQRVYVISDDDGSASVAAGVLRASGDIDAVVIDGGMKAWMDHGLPVRRGGLTVDLPRGLRIGAGLLALACIALAANRPLIASLTLVVGVALLLKAQLLEKKPGFETVRNRRGKSDPFWGKADGPKNAPAY